MNLITQTIALPQKYTVPEDQIAERDALIAKSQQYCGGVVSADGQSTAVEFGQAIHRQIKAVQEARSELAKPLNLAAKKLITIEESAQSRLLTLSRISGNKPLIFLERY